MFKDLDTVELTHDVKKFGLKEGDFGAIVNVYNEGKAYEVEFVAPGGRTKALLTLLPGDIRPVTTKTNVYSDTTFATENAYSGVVKTKINKDDLNYYLKLGTKTKKSGENTEEFHYQYQSII